MSILSSILISIAVCAAAALLEGLFAGKNVKAFFGKLRAPRYSPPLWLWAIIGFCYYGICFTLLYLILRTFDNALVNYTALILLLIVMFVNAFWNYVFFRLENLFLSFVLGIFYSVAAILLFLCLVQYHQLAALILMPYLIYLIYAFYWGYNLLKLNPKQK